jgi:hypothetical protein
MEPKLHRDCMVWLTSKTDGWWYCYENVRLSAGLVSDLFGPFDSEHQAWLDARGRIEGSGGRRGGFRDAERSYVV